MSCSCSQVIPCARAWLDGVGGVDTVQEPLTVPKEGMKVRFLVPASYQFTFMDFFFYESGQDSLQVGLSQTPGVFLLDVFGEGIELFGQQKLVDGGLIVLLELTE